LRKVDGDSAGLSRGWGGLFASWIFFVEYAMMMIMMKKKWKVRMLMELTKKVLKDTSVSWYIRMFCGNVFNGRFLFALYVTPIL
jgi:hypothetical protein